MKRFVLVALLAFGAGQALAAPALVQSTSGGHVQWTGAAVTDQAMDFGSNVTAGNSIICVATPYHNSVDLTTPTDDGSSTYTEVADSGVPSSNVRAYIWAAHNVSGGFTGVDLHGGGGLGLFGQAECYEFSGLAATPNDQTCNGQFAPGTAGDDPEASCAISTLAQAEELVIALMGNDDAFDSNINITGPTGGGTYANLYKENNAASNSAGSADYVVTAATTGFTVQYSHDDLGNGATGWASAAATFKASASTTTTQARYRWFNDDGAETATTGAAAENTALVETDNQSKLVRARIDASGDPASAAYTLRYQKNGSGGYTALPVGSTTPGSISNQLVAASADDSQDIAGTNTINGTTIGASLDATNEWVGMRFTNITIPAGATITSALVGVVPSGTGEDEPLVTVFLEAADDCATFTTGASNISNRSRTTGVSWSSTDLAASGSSYHDTPSLVADVQAVIDRAGWASGNDLCVIIQGGATGTRDLTIEAQDLGPNTNPPRISLGWTVPNEVYVATSANIAAGGEATTARLTAGSGSFVTGRRWDNENGSDSIDITTNNYTEVEWSVGLGTAPVLTDFYDFRVYAGANPLDTYTVTPRWTVGNPAFDSGPTVTAVDHNTFRVTYDANTASDNIYCGAWLKDATAPTEAQIEAGTNAHGTGTEATTGVSDTLDFDVTENPAYPIYDVYCVLEGAQILIPETFFDHVAANDDRWEQAA